MEQVEVKNLLSHKKNSKGPEENHPDCVSLQNVTKLTIKTKNGLVNGVTEEKSKSNRKSIDKDCRKSKKGHNSELHVTSLNSTKKDNSQKSSDNKTKENCESETVSLEQSSSKDVNTKVEQTQSSQSELNMREPKTKRKKKKSKSNKTVQPVQPQEPDFNMLPQFDLTSIMNATINNEGLVKKEDLPSTSQSGSSMSHLLEYQDTTSDFEKTLIESIKSLKLQQQEKCPIDLQSDVEPKQAEPVEEESLCDITYVQYESELQMPMIMKIIQKDLSEPYSIYTYRYFIHNWPSLCFLAMCEDKCVGAIVCKLDYHRKTIKRGYIAMLAVDQMYRKRRIGSTLVRRAISEMKAGNADEVVLETEVTNKPALLLYERLGFVRDKRLFRYYLNGVDALRLKLWLR